MSEFPDRVDEKAIAPPSPSSGEKSVVGLSRSQPVRHSATQTAVHHGAHIAGARPSGFRCRLNMFRESAALVRVAGSSDRSIPGPVIYTCRGFLQPLHTRGAQIEVFGPESAIKRPNAAYRRVLGQILPHLVPCLPDLTTPTGRVSAGCVQDHKKSLEPTPAFAVTLYSHL